MINIIFRADELNGFYLLKIGWILKKERNRGRTIPVPYEKILNYKNTK